MRAVGRSLSPGSYEARLIIAALVAGGLARWVHLSPLWAIISAILVLQPDPGATIRATYVRFVATVIGGASSVGAVALGLAALPGLALALVVTCIICVALDLEDGLRPACVSAAVLLVQPGSDTAPVGEVKLALARILAMLGGGAVALVAAHFPRRRATKPTGTE